MEFGKHLGKGIWGFADKALPAVYGVVFMFVVIRSLPAEEYGAYFLFQSVFLLITTLGYSFAIQPMLKYVAEGHEVSTISSSAFVLLTLLIGTLLGVFIIFNKFIFQLLDAQHIDKLRSLFFYLPFVFAASLYRLIATGLLQAKLEIKKLFFVDTWYYSLSLSILLGAKILGFLTSAEIVIYTLIIVSLISSVISYYMSRNIAVARLRWEPKSGGMILKYGRFGLVNNVGYLVQTQFDTFFISAYGGVAGVAMYGAAKNFTRIFDIFSQVIQMLVLPATSMLQGRKEEHKLTALVEKSICFSFFAILPIILGIELFPELLYNLFYGGRYLESIVLLKILTLTAFFVPWSQVISSVLLGLGKASTGTKFSIAIVVLSIAAYAVFGSFGGIQGICWGILLVQCIIIPIGVIVLKRSVPFTLRSTLGRSADIINYIRNSKNLFSSQKP